MTPHDGLAAYAAARWPAVVRTLVLLGAPPALAQRLAGEATARLLAEPDGTADLAPALLAQVVAAWEDDRSAWWPRPGVLDPDLEGRLDRLDPATRARLVLGAVAELTPEQVDEVVVGGGPAPADLAARVASAAHALDVDPPAVAAAASSVRGRVRRRRTAGVVGLAAAAALVVVGLVVLVDPREPEPPPPAAGFRPPGGPTTERTVVVRNGGDAPVPWYDGTVVHLDARTRVEVDLLRSMSRVRGGVAGVRSDGVVVVVTARGAQVLGRTRPGALVATSPDSDGVAWLDPGGDLVLAQVAPGPVRVDVPEGARLALRDGTDTYLDLDPGHLVVDDRTRRRDVPGPAPLDIAGDTRLEAVPRGLRVVSAAGSVVLDGASAMGARLSDDGRYVLLADLTSSSSSPDEVVEVATGERVVLPVPDDGRVVDLAFGPDDVVTLALSRPDGARFPATVPRGNGAQPGYDLVTCRLREGTCQVAAQLDNAARAPLLAR